MKHKNSALDVDFIGEQSALTKAEEEAISKYFKSKKTKSALAKSPSKRSTKPGVSKKVIA
jgi:hypothetical protein